MQNSITSPNAGSNQIVVKELRKSYRYSVKSGNFLADLFSPKYKDSHALSGISFSVRAGESVAFIGPNGAGKSTTIKILTGILTQTDGMVQVEGLTPQKDRKALAYKIGTVFGTRSQLMYNLPLRDSFDVFGAIYEMSKLDTTKRFEQLSEIFSLAEFAQKPVRKLSLGQRMRAEVALALLHSPEIIFLDEPTIGLDIIAKKELRTTLRSLNKTMGTTIFLTSHDMSDIEALCERTIVIDKGMIIADAPTLDFKSHFGKIKDIKIKLADPTEIFAIGGIDGVEKVDDYFVCRLDLEHKTLNDFISEVVGKYKIEDIDVSDPNLEEVIEQIFRQEKAKE